MIDWNAIIAGLQNVFAFVLGWLSTHLETQEQQLLFAAGAALAAVSAYAAWRSKRIASYKLAVFGVKAGFAMMFLALGWSNVKELYSQATAAFGTPLAGIMAVFMAGVLGYEVVSRFIPKKKQG